MKKSLQKKKLYIYIKKKNYEVLVALCASGIISNGEREKERSGRQTKDR